MRIRLELVSLVVFVAVSSGCTKPAAERTVEVAAPSANVAAQAAPPPPAAAQSTPPAPFDPRDVHASTDPRFARLSIMERLAVERANRPAVAPGADAVLAKLPVGVEDRKQVAAWPIGARYCEKAQTKHDVHVVVCEFTDEASAAKGVEAAASTNKYLKRRELLKLRATSLSVLRAGATPAADADARKIEDTFRAM